MTSKPRLPLLAAAAALALALPASAKAPAKVSVPLKTADGKDAGTATFSQSGKMLKVQLKLMNLTPGQHGVHIHQNAKCDAPDFKSAGGHFNPTGKQHGYQNPEGHHEGDLPQNVTIGANGEGRATIMVDDLSLDPSAPDSIFANGGTAIMVHAGPDDMKSDPAGDSGARIACGVITQQAQ